MGFYFGVCFILVLFSSVFVCSYHSVAVKNTITKAILTRESIELGACLWFPRVSPLTSWQEKTDRCGARAVVGSFTS